MTETSFYERLGGAEGVRRLVDRFYDAMDAREEARTVRAMHPADLASSREKLFLFLSGWLGGPPLYVERYGHPRLRARHLPFSIDTRARDEWMLCMDCALDATELDPENRAQLRGAFMHLASHMRNQEESEPPVR